jgi:hypothetical protein
MYFFETPRDAVKQAEAAVSDYGSEGWEFESFRARCRSEALSRIVEAALLAL